MARPLAPCGTEAAYRRHRRAGESCEECMAAEAARKREKRAERRSAADAEITGQPEFVVVEQKIRAGEEPRLLEVPSGEDPVEAARWRLAKVRASMVSSTPRDMAGLAKREEEIVELLGKLTGSSGAGKPEKRSALDELADRRAKRIAEATG